MNQSIKKSYSIIAIIIIIIIGVVVFSRTKFGSVSLTISPDSGSVAVNDTFAVDIILDTAGQETYGVDIYSLRFDPRILQVVDDDTVTAGTQITAGSLMNATVFNMADNTAGTVQFSQVMIPSTDQTGVFRGSGVLASVTFKVIAEGSSNLTLDFTPGASTDTNVAGSKGDLLSSVKGGAYVATVGDI